MPHLRLCYFSGLKFGVNAALDLVVPVIGKHVYSKNFAREFQPKEAPFADDIRWQHCWSSNDSVDILPVNSAPTTPPVFATSVSLPSISGSTTGLLTLHVNFNKHHHFSDVPSSSCLRIC